MYLFAQPLLFVVKDSFSSLCSVFAFAPDLIIVIVLLWISWLMGRAFEKGIIIVFRALRADHSLETLGLKKLLARGGLRLDTGLFFGGLAKWFIVCGFMIASLEILGLSQIVGFLLQMLTYYVPQVFNGALVLSVVAVFALVVKKTITVFSKAIGIQISNFIGAFSGTVVWLIAILLLFTKFNIDPTLTKILFTGIVAMTALAGGLAFGLGGKEEAGVLLTKIRREFSEHF